MIGVVNIVFRLFRCVYVYGFGVFPGVYWKPVDVDTVDNSETHFFDGNLNRLKEPARGKGIGFSFLWLVNPECLRNCVGGSLRRSGLRMGNSLP